MTNYRKRLIEVSLPLEAISKQSAREKSIRHGHISTLHIWWARRPLAAMRAAIFASLIPAPETERERKELENLIKVIVDWDQVKDGNSRAILKARRIIQEAYPDGAPELLDPFMGGGATGLEALRLGCDTHAIELNPVAHIIELCTLVYPQKYGQPEKRLVRQGAVEVEQEVNPLAEDVRQWGHWISEKTQEVVGNHYRNPVDDQTIVGYLWARAVKCPNPSCGAEIPLVRQWWLAKNRHLSLRPVANHETKTVKFEVVNLAQANVDGFDPSNGTTSRAHATCLICGQVASAKHIRSEGRNGRMQETPLAVIEASEGKGKGYRQFTEQDRALFNTAKRESTTVADLAPDQPIPLMSGTFNAPIYGLDTWGALFNPRQLLMLLTLVEKTRDAYSAMIAQGYEADRARSVVTYLALAIDRIADYNSTLCAWANHGEYAGHTFARNALPMVWDYAELNPFSGSTGDWSGAIDWIVRVIEHASKVSTSSASVHQGTATRLPYSDDVFDAIITDPPYYNAVPYADLSDFFYVWLRKSIGDLYPEIFRTPLAPKSPEIAEMSGWDPERYAHKDKAFYETEMTKAFQEAQRVLARDGVFNVVFAHKSISAWETLLNSLLDAGLVVTASWPLHTEMSARLRAQGSAALASSIFIVCRQRVTETEGFQDDVRSDLQRVIKDRLDFFWSEGIRGADFFISAIGPAVSVFGRYSKVYRLDGSEVGVDALLDLVQELVADYALDRILNGHRESVGAVDAATRYYILHRWSYSSTDVPFDDAMRLAMALGADIDALMDRRGVLKQSGETVKLLGPKQRGKREELGEVDRTGRIAPVIDVLHRAVALWESGQRHALARFLADNAHGREEQVRLVAQTLIDILPQDDRERRLLEGFLAGRDSVPDAPRQERLL